MALFSFLDLSHAFGGPPVFDHVNFQVDAGERVCLIGRNGAGKSTLMRIIAGEVKPDSGSVFRQPGAHFARLTQEIPTELTGRVHEIVASGVRSEAAGGPHEEDWQREIRLEKLIERMELPAEAEFQSLSGGLKRRTLIARALAGQPDLLLLDEPTNHLDLASVLWLEEFLLNEKVSLFFVTHDRAFLRRLATRIVELDRGIITNWDCDYATFLVRREERYAAGCAKRGLVLGFNIGQPTSRQKTITEAPRGEGRKAFVDRNHRPILPFVPIRVIRGFPRRYRGCGACRRRLACVRGAGLHGGQFHGAFLLPRSLACLRRSAGV